jgi:hypothetical protein
MSTSTLPAELPPDGLYRVYRVRFGVAYNGWYLVTAVTPGDTAARIEFAFLALDPEASGLPRITPEFNTVNAQTEIWPLVLNSELGHRITDLHHHIEAWGRERGIPDQRRPEYSEVSQRELLNLGLATLAKPDDDQFLKVWQGGLDRLRGWTRCPVLKEYLHRIRWKERVSVERG